MSLAPRAVRLIDMDNRYEALRSFALGASLPLEARAGLVILITRGVSAWIRVVVNVVPVSEPVQEFPPEASLNRLPATPAPLAQVLAGMLLEPRRIVGV